jgi:hypothetical protein
LYNVILCDIKSQLEIAQKYEEALKAYTNEIMQNSGVNSEDYTAAEIEKQNIKLSDINRIVKKLLEQNALGVISDERFAEFSADYEKEILTVKATISRLFERLEFEKTRVNNAEILHAAICKYLDIKELTADIIIDLIDKIIIHEPRVLKDECGGRQQKIEINYRFFRNP